MDGYGVYTWLQDGRKYEGHYKNDKKHGQGIYTWADGRKYDGQWQNGKQHGHGKYISKEGKQRQGIWKNGKREKWLDGGGAGEESVFADN